MEPCHQQNVGYLKYINLKQMQFNVLLLVNVSEMKIIMLMLMLHFTVVDV